MMYVQSNLSDECKSWSKEELWVAFSGDDRKAFSLLFLQSYEQLFRYGMHFSSQEATVKDGIQKLFFRLWKKRKTLSSPQSVDGYLYVSLRRILLRKQGVGKGQEKQEF